MDTKTRSAHAQARAVEEERQLGSRQLAAKQSEVGLIGLELDYCRGRLDRLTETLSRWGGTGSIMSVTGEWHQQHTILSHPGSPLSMTLPSTSGAALA